MVNNSKVLYSSSVNVSINNGFVSIVNDHIRFYTIKSSRKWYVF